MPTWPNPAPARCRRRSRWPGRHPARSRPPWSTIPPRSAWRRSRSTCCAPSSPRRRRRWRSSRRRCSQAELNVGYTTITAPVDGTVGARTLRVGQYVQAGTQSWRVVPLAAVYVTANYKETQLTDVRARPACRPSTSTLFPGSDGAGRGEQHRPGRAAQEFALLPPDNATGNFTKIVQRDPGEDHDRPARPAGRPAAPGHVGRADHRHHAELRGPCAWHDPRPNTGAAVLAERPGSPSAARCSAPSWRC